jgi:hypothetical protein
MPEVEKKSRLMTGMEVAAILGGLVTVAVGYFEYREAQSVEKARRTMEQIAYWENGGARTAYRSLSRAAEEVFAGIPNDQLAKAKADETGKLSENLRRNIAARVLVSDQHAQDDIDEVVYFFSRLGLCIEAKICDRCSANVFFGDTLTSFLEIFRVAIEARSEMVPGYGAAMLEMDRDMKKVALRGMDTCQNRRVARRRPTGTP